MKDAPAMEKETLLTLTADIVSAHVANNSVSVNDLPALVQNVHNALSALGQSAPEPVQEKVPVVSIRASIKPEYLVCMECGRKQKTLKRHLQSAHGMTPDQYRADYGLPRDYPMTAPEYSQQRGAMAKSIGLGRKREAPPAPAPAPEPKAAAPKRRRLKIATPAKG